MLIKFKKTELIDTENKLEIARARGGERGWAEWVKGVKRYKFPVTK